MPYTNPRSADVVIRKAKGRSMFGDKAFPLDGPSHGIFMFFQEYKYQAGAISSIRDVGSIALPLPQGIQDNLTINVQQADMGMVGAGAIEAYQDGQKLQTIADEISKAGERAAKITKEIYNGDYTSLQGNVNTPMSYTNFMGRAALSAIPGAGSGLSVATGHAVNPHATLVFEGVQLKSFTFNWTLSPSNKHEMTAISDIIKTIKSKILPKYKGGGATALSRGLLTYPHMVHLELQGIDPNHIFKFKPMMVSNFSADYSPNGNVFNRDDGGSAPAVVNLSMTFNETEIWTADDFEG